MLKKSLLSSGGIFVMLVLALASLGVTYGLWSETLHIDGTVNTGEVDVGFSGPLVGYGVEVNGVLMTWDYQSDAGADPAIVGNVSDPHGLLVGAVATAPQVKDLSTCTASPSKDPTSVSFPDNVNSVDDGNNLITVTVTNAYPSFHCVIAFDVTNFGTIPVKIHQPEIDLGATPVGLIDTDFGNCYIVDRQLEPGDSSENCTITIHFTNSDVNIFEESQYTFSVLVFAHQWNEEPGQ